MAIEMPVRQQFPQGDAGTDEFRKSLLEYAVAMDVAGDYPASVAALKTLNPDRYKELTPKKE